MSTAASDNVNPASSGASVAAEAKPVPRPARTMGWAFSRLLVTLGALLFAYAFWLPWELVTISVPTSAATPSVQLAVSLSAVTSFRLATVVADQAMALFLTSLLAVLGILLSPLLWRRSDSLLGAIATHLLGVWLLFATLLTIQMRALDAGVLKGISQQAVASLVNLRYSYVIGFWLAIVALVLLWIGIALLLFSEWRMHAFWHGLPSWDGERSRAAIPGTALLTLGLLIWAYGFLSAAWLTFNCTSQPLLFGTCQGLDANGVMSTFITNSGASQSALILAVDPQVARYAISLLLGGGALLVLLGAWQRARSVTYSIWATLWLLAAIGFAALAYYGTTLLTAPGAQLPKGVTGVSGAVGILATIVGLAFALIGLVPFWLAALRRRGEA